jgi:hypothetical protein
MWTSKTNRFLSQGLIMLEGLPADELASALLVSPAIMILRALAEIMLNEDHEKLKALLDNEELWEKCQRFGYDPGADLRDFEYAKQLRNIKAAMV